MSDGEPQYLLPEPEKEIERLTKQDAVITYFMNDKRIVAPIDLQKPGLQILDSATADGLFLREIRPLLAEPYTLLGYDIMPSFFPQTSPPNMTLVIHDMAEQWPAELRGKCDLVHQHFAIVGGAQKATPRQIVKYLCELVKPGGWIQLGEMDLSGPVQGGSALHDTITAIRSFFAVAGAGPGAPFANEMTGWLKEEGFINTQELHFDIDMGPTCKDAEWGEKSAQVMVAAATSMSGACRMMKVDVPESVLDSLPERAAEEFTKQGGTHRIIIAIGQKPL